MLHFLYAVTQIVVGFSFGLLIFLMHALPSDVYLSNICVSMMFNV